MSEIKELENITWKKEKPENLYIKTGIQNQVDFLVGNDLEEILEKEGYDNISIQKIIKNKNYLEEKLKTKIDNNKINDFNFISFLENSDIGMLEFFINNIEGLNLEKIFKIYLYNNKFFEHIRFKLYGPYGESMWYYDNLQKIKDKEKIIIELIKYHLSKKNFYFLGENLEKIIDSNIKYEDLEKIIEYLDENNGVLKKYNMDCMEKNIDCVKAIKEKILKIFNLGKIENNKYIKLFDELFNIKRKKIDDIYKDEKLKIFLENSEMVKENIILFLKQVPFKYDINIINPDFIEFIKNTFGNKKIDDDIGFTNEFWDEEIKNYNYFRKGKIETKFIVEKTSILEFFPFLNEFGIKNEDYTISNCKKIEKKYLEKYPNDSRNLGEFLSGNLTSKTWLIRYITNSFNGFKNPDNLTIENMLYLLDKNKEIFDGIGGSNNSKIITIFELLENFFDFKLEDLYEIKNGEISFNNNFTFVLKQIKSLNLNKDELEKKGFQDLDGNVINFLDDFYKNFKVNSFLKFLNQFQGTIIFKSPWNFKGALELLVNYSIKKNNFNFLEQNFEVIINSPIRDSEENLKKVEEILETTGGFLIKEIVKLYIIEQKINKSELKEVSENYKNFINILSNGGTLEGLNDKYGLKKIAIENVYPSRVFTGNIIYYTDKTEHLNKYKYDKNGYNIILGGKNEYKLDGELNKNLNGISNDIIELLKDKENILDFIKKYFKNEEIELKTQTLEGNILEYFIYLEKQGRGGLYKDLNILIAYQILDRREEFLKLYNYGENDTKLYNQFYILGDEYGDKLKETKNELLKKISVEDKEILNSLIDNSENKNYKKVLNKKETIKNNISKIPKDYITLDKIKPIISKHIKAFFNDEQLSFLLKEIEKENLESFINNFDEIFDKIITSIFEKDKLNFNFINNLGNKTYNIFQDEINKFKLIKKDLEKSQIKTIKAYFLKTKESSRALAVGGACIGKDYNRWGKERYFELVLIDQSIRKCVGAIELLEMNDEKGKFLFFGPNPNENILQKIDEEKFYNEIKNIIINFAKNNGFDGILTDIGIGRATNSTGKFYSVFKNSVKGKISLDREYYLGTYGGHIYSFKDSLDIVWKKC